MLPEKLFGIIGHPLGHTMSPALHNWGFAAKGFPGVYMKWDILPERLADFMTGVRTLPVSGLSVTIPHKRAVREFLDEETFRAKSVGAVNTLFWKDGRLWGENTDVLGCIAPLAARNPLPGSALVLGAGGAARAMVAGLGDLGVREVFVANRTAFKASSLAHDFSIRDIAWEERMACEAELIVNTTPLGMLGGNVDRSPMEGYVFKPGQIAYDLVYNPLRTRFLQDAARAGCVTISGLEMFLGQGAAQFELWTGMQFEMDGAYRLLTRELGLHA